MNYIYLNGIVVKVYVVKYSICTVEQEFDVCCNYVYGSIMYIRVSSEDDLCGLKHVEDMSYVHKTLYLWYARMG